MAVEILKSCDLMPFSSSATVKAGDNVVALMFVNNHEDRTGDGWRLLQRSEIGSLWSRPAFSSSEQIGASMIEVEITDADGRLIASAQVWDAPYEAYFMIGDQTYKIEVRDRPKPEKRASGQEEAGR